MLGETNNIGSLSFSSYDNFSYFADTSSPSVSTVVFSEDNHQIDRFGDYGKQYDNESSVYLLKAGDNVSLRFKTDESVDKPLIGLNIGGNAVDNSSFSISAYPPGSPSGEE